jgi:hypothetical protein
MASLDIWQHQEMPGARVVAPNGPSLAEQFGAPLQDLGRAASGAALDIARADAIVQQRQEKRDQDATLNGILQFGSDLDAGFADLQKNAQPGAPGFTAAALGDFDKRQKDFMASVPDSQKAYATEELLRLRRSVQKGAIEFETLSKQTFDKQQSAAIIDQGASWLVTNPDRLDFVRDQVVNKIKAMNLSPQEEAATLADLDSGLGSAALAGAVQKSPRSALAAIDAGKWGFVHADKLAQLRGQAQAKIKADDALARAEADRRRAYDQADLLGRLDLAIPAMQGTGVIPTDPKTGQPLVDVNEITALIPGRRGEALKRQFITAQQEGEDRLSVLTTSLPDDYAKLAGMAPQPGQPWSDEQQHRYSTFAAIVDDKQKKLEDDGASLVVGSPAIQQAWATADSLAQTPGADPKTVQQATSAAVNATVQAQIDMGAAPWQAKPLTKARAAGYAGQLNGAQTPEEFQGLARNITGLGPQAVSQVVAAGAPPVFAAMTAIDDPLVVAQFAQAAKLKPSEASSILQSAGVTRDKVADAVRDKLAPLYVSMPPESRALYQDGFTQAAIYALGRGATDETAAADAVTRSLLSGYQFDGNLRISADLDLGKVKAGMAQSVSDLLSGKAGIEVVPPPGFHGISALQEAARHGGLTWYMNEAGDGAVLATPEGRWIQVVNRTSQDRATTGRFEVKFSDAARAGAAVVMTPQGEMVPADQPKNPALLPSAGITTIMNLTPQEQFLYNWHVNNVTGRNGGKSFKQPNGATSTVLQMVEPSEVFGLNDGRWRNIPSVWDGKPHTEDQAIEHAKRIGIGKWPSYATQKEAQDRYDQMHAFMEKDVQ